GNNVPTTLLALDKLGNVYFGTSRDEVYSLSPSGETRWKYETDDAPYSLAIDDNDNIYATTEAFTLYSLTSDGKLRWTQQTGSGSTFLAIGYDGTIYAGNDQGHVLAFTNDGEFKWGKHIEEPIRSSPTIGKEGNVYFGAGKDIYALNPEGELLWSVPTKGEIWASPSVNSDGMVYVASQDKKVYMIDTDEKFIGAHSERYIMPSSITIGEDGTLYLTAEESEGKYLYAVGPKGGLKWKYKIGQVATTPPAIGADGTLYVSGGSIESDRGYLYALSPEGKLISKYNTGSVMVEFSSPAICNDGTLYFASVKRTKSYGDIGIIYAFQTESYGLAASPWPKFGADNQNTSRAR
ncbi:MAG: PQQ-binding-like beta-propeller repeat protein, partial [candidate division WOR-3 bacterium]|nr:PQQ-binding-like beta-propeller repeat protein [candidate division WOR-3 bacterium]